VDDAPANGGAAVEQSSSAAADVDADFTPDHLDSFMGMPGGMQG